MEITDVKSAVLVVKTNEDVFTLMFIDEGHAEEYNLMDKSSVELIKGLIEHIRKAMLICNPMINA